MWIYTEFQVKNADFDQKNVAGLVPLPMFLHFHNSVLQHTLAL